jgi:hypothetical protein
VNFFAGKCPELMPARGCLLSAIECYSLGITIENRDLAIKWQVFAVQIKNSGQFLIYKICS